METDYPLARSDFQTDGRRLFLEVMDIEGNPEDRKLYDLLSGQYVIHRAVAPLFKQLEFGFDHQAHRWWPLGRRRHVVVDPHRSFGKPITKTAGVPTETIKDALRSIGDPAAVARWYEVPRSEIEDALKFELTLERAPTPGVA
ncbi:DUF433 domain-containing protein [Geminicoccus harenae]|uniref:DUF433 domain-containing protein n=1 Tax=Geminicoccus harenae TaxID=2498453 RepID=UPI00168AAF24|nr:DUF433 domain-containing protein [Geminicoccus harenae]